VRQDNTAFADVNNNPVKSPRYTIEVSFDDANTDLYYFTSHSDAATPPAATVINSVIAGLSVTSQRIQPEKALASIGKISFTAVDLNNQIRSTQSSELAFGNSLKEKRVRVYMGYEDADWSTYIAVQTQIIDNVTYKDNVYTFNCADVQRLEKKDIFNLARTTLAVSLSATVTTVTVYDTSSYEAVKHSAYWSDAPSQTVYYIKIEDEIIRATGKTSTTFTGCTRGVLNTKAVVHTIDVTDSADRRTEVNEYVYLELPAPKMIYALMTGILHNDSANLPDSWHLGISTDYVYLADFTGIGDDLWDLTDEAIGAVLRFEGEEKQDGKKFIEEQINLAVACFNIIYATGELGLRRMTHVIADAPHVLELTESNVRSYGSLTHDMAAVRNHLEFLWNWESTKGKFTRKNILFDTQSIAIHGQSKTATVKFRGVHGNVHTSTTIEQIFDSLRDRFTEPPMRIDVETHFSLNTLEVGDVVKLNLLQVMDYNTDTALNRSFEIQRIAIDWVRGTVRLSLFGSAAKAGTIVRATATTVLNDAYYTQEGNDLKTYVGGGYDAGTDYSANHIIADTQLTGGADLKNASYIYYHDGDLTIDAGVTVTTTDNVQLRVKGFLTINGTVNGKGLSSTGINTSGYVGTSQAQGGLYTHGSPKVSQEWVEYSTSRPVYSGLNAAVPELSLGYDSVAETLNGIPSNLRGSRGGSGGAWQDSADGTKATGGNAGTAGAGLLYIGRGLGFGVSGSIDLSGNDGSSGSTNTSRVLGYPMAAGGGAGGGAGSMHIILDGSTAVATFDNTNLLLCRGSVSYALPPLPNAGKIFLGSGGERRSSYFSGLNNGCLFSSQHRVQYVPSVIVVEPDLPPDILTAPTGLVITSGSTELFQQPDGTIVPRAKLTWVAAIDAKVVGYEVQYKKSADSLWTSSTNVLGAESTETHVLGVLSSIDYDFRIRSAAGDGTSSDWLTVTAHTVVGKFDPPSDVTGFSAYQNGASLVMKWNLVTDTDLSGYEIRYLESTGSGLWLDGVILNAVTKGTNITTVDIQDGTWLLMIKAINTSNVYSDTEDSFTVTFSSDFDVIDASSYAPFVLGTLTNMIWHHTGKLVPDSQDAASLDTWDTFDITVPNPYADCYYEAPEYDNGFDDESRISAIITSYLAPTEITGSASPNLEIDYKTVAGSYDGFEPWSLGNATFRYLKSRAHIDTGVGVAILTEFTQVVDAVEFTQKAENVAVDVSGTTIVFVVPFHNEPHVDITPISSSAVIFAISGKTTTQFTIKLFDTDGVGLAGTVDWKAIGV